MIDLGSSVDVSRLYTAIKASRDAMRPFRQNRTLIIGEFVGSWYEKERSGGSQLLDNEVLVNLLSQTADAYTIGLAANCPRVRVTTKARDQWPFAKRYEVAINNLIVEMRFSETMQAIVLDAMFSLGIAKTHLGKGNVQDLQLVGDEWADPGRPYISRVSLDDFVWDMSVKERRRCQFMSDEYRVSWDACKAHPGFDKEVLKKLSPNSKYDRGEEQTADIAAGSIIDGDEYQPMIDLMDVWLPELQVVATFSRHVEGKPLMVAPWDGPEGGPYDVLTFSEVPDNVMPSSPLQNLMGLHLLYQGLLRKHADQAKRQKTVTGYRSTAADDMNRLRNTRDGHSVKLNDPDSIRQYSFGGVDPQNMAFSVGVMDLFNRQAGNLEAMAGLGPQAGTAAQENIIAQAVSRKEAKMQGHVHAFTAAVLGKLGHLMWADSVLKVPGQFEVAHGTGVYADATWTPELREGDFWQYNFDIQPYSMNYEPPEAKQAKLDKVYQTIMPLQPILQQSGLTFDGKAMVRMYAELLNLPELEQVVTFAPPPTAGMMPGQEQGGGPGMPQNTTREYIRRSVPTGGTPASRSAAVQQALMGGGSLNQAQRTAMSRPA